MTQELSYGFYKERGDGPLVQKTIDYRNLLLIYNNEYLISIPENYRSGCYSKLQHGRRIISYITFKHKNIDKNFPTTIDFSRVRIKFYFKKNKVSWTCPVAICFKENSIRITWPSNRNEKLASHTGFLVKCYEFNPEDPNINPKNDPINYYPEYPIEITEQKETNKLIYVVWDCRKNGQYEFYDNGNLHTIVHSGRSKEMGMGRDKNKYYKIKIEYDERGKIISESIIT